MENQLERNMRHAGVRKTLLAVLACNWTVACAKIVFGIASRSSSIMADGFHSLSDGTSNIIGLVGMRIAGKPSDKDHPYGHAKYETFSSLGIAILLFLMSLSLLHEGVDRIFHPVTPKVNAVSFIIMAATTIINAGVMRYEFMRGKALHSDILRADAMHTRADIITSLSVIITLIAVKAGFPLLDAIATIFIALFIAWAGIGIVRESSNVLCDSAAIIDVQRIADIVLTVRGVRACHKIRSRGRSDDIHIDLHVQVAPDMHMGDAHKVSYAIERAIKERLPQVSDVLVHLEPKE